MVGDLAIAIGAFGRRVAAELTRQDQPEDATLVVLQKSDGTAWKLLERETTAGLSGGCRARATLARRVVVLLAPGETETTAPLLQILSELQEQGVREVLVLALAEPDEGLRDWLYGIDPSLDPDGVDLEANLGLGAFEGVHLAPHGVVLMRFHGPGDGRPRAMAALVEALLGANLQLPDRARRPEDPSGFGFWTSYHVVDLANDPDLLTRTLLARFLTSYLGGPGASQAPPPGSDGLVPEASVILGHLREGLEQVEGGPARAREDARLLREALIPLCEEARQRRQAVENELSRERRRAFLLQPFFWRKRRRLLREAVRCRQQEGLLREPMQALERCEGALEGLVEGLSGLPGGLPDLGGELTTREGVTSAPLEALRTRLAALVADALEIPERDAALPCLLEGLVQQTLHEGLDGQVRIGWTPAVQSRLEELGVAILQNAPEPKPRPDGTAVESWWSLLLPEWLGSQPAEATVTKFAGAPVRAALIMPPRLEVGLARFACALDLPDALRRLGSGTPLASDFELLAQREIRARADFRRAAGAVLATVSTQPERQLTGGPFLRFERRAGAEIMEPCALPREVRKASWLLLRDPDVEETLAQEWQGATEQGAFGLVGGERMVQFLRQWTGPLGLNLPGGTRDQRLDAAAGALDAFLRNDPRIPSGYCLEWRGPGAGAPPTPSPGPVPRRQGEPNLDGFEYPRTGLYCGSCDYYLGGAEGAIRTRGCPRCR